MSDLSIKRDMQRQLAEKAFEATVREYILDTGIKSFGDGRKYQFGGAYNLISTIRAVFADLADQTGCDDYATVAGMLMEVEHEADLPYSHMEE